jgi:hypothetical protein
MEVVAYRQKIANLMKLHVVPTFLPLALNTLPRFSGLKDFAWLEPDIRSTVRNFLHFKAIDPKKQADVPHG